MDNPKTGYPYCDGDYCDEPGLYLCLQKPFENMRFCVPCLNKYVYQRRPFATPKHPSEEPLPDNVQPLKK